MKILAHSTLTGKKGGAETAYETIVEGLSDRGISLTKTYYGRHIDIDSIKYEKSQIYINMYNIFRLRDLRSPRILGRLIRPTLRLYRFVKTQEPDIVFINFFKKSAFNFAILKPLLGFKLVICLHGSDLLRAGQYERNILAFCLRLTDQVVVVSDNMRSHIAENYSYNDSMVTVVHNGFDNSLWGSKKDVDDYEKHIVSVGSLRMVKGHDVLIEAFAEIKRKHPEASLTIVGEGRQRQKYESLICALGLEESVHLTGWLSQEHVKREMDQASIFVFPSRSEGFGIALLEAMASGLPVVASRVGGIPEAVAGTNSILVPPNDPLVLASVLSDKLSDGKWQKEASVASRKRAQQFSWEKAVEQYEAVFENIVAT